MKIQEQMLHELEARKKHYEEERERVINTPFSEAATRNQLITEALKLEGRVEEIEDLIVYVTYSLKEDKK